MSGQTNNLSGNEKIQHSPTVEKQLVTSENTTLRASTLVPITFTACFFSMFAMADQTAIPIILPFIAEDLDAHNTIQWAGTGALISSTIFNIIIGRFADFFGRRLMMIISLFIIGIFEVMCVFAWNSTAFYIFRALTGLGNGGTISLAIVIVSDNVAHEQKATFQGLLGLSIGIGSCFGPFLSSAFVSNIRHVHSGWKQYFFLMGCVFILSGFLSILTLSQTKEHKQVQPKKILKSIDFPGLIFSTAVVILILLPLNMGGLNWDWKGLKVILCCVFAFLSFVVLILVEYGNKSSALIPMSSFTNFKVCNFILQTFLISIVYSSMIYHLPIYFTSVHEIDTSHIPIILLAMLIPLALGSAVSGPIISSLNRFKYVIVLGYTLVLMSLVMLCSTPKTPLKIKLRFSIITLIFMGTGFGFIFTPLTTGIQSQVSKKDVSVVLSTKAVMKNFGNSLGIAMSYVIFSNSLITKLEKLELNENSKNFVMKSLGKKINLSFLFHGESLIELEKIYASSLKNVFIVWIPVTIICLVLSLFLENKGVENIADE